MKKGILLLSHTKYEYHYAAQNLAASIKHYNSSIHITNLRSREGEEYLLPSHNFFDEVVYMDDEDCINPTIAKLSIIKYLPYENTLVIDADSICMQDVSPLLDKLVDKDKYFMTEIMGSGYFGEEINYDLWAHHSDSFDFFDVDKKDKWYATQSSWMFFKKCKETKELFKELKKYYNKNFDYNKLKNVWGKYLPDELFYSGVISKKRIDASCDIKNIMFFGVKYHELNYVNSFYFMSLHGQGIGEPTTKLMYWEYYDRLMMQILAAKGLEHIYKGNYLRKVKVSNGK